MAVQARTAKGEPGSGGKAKRFVRIGQTKIKKERIEWARSVYGAWMKDQLDDEVVGEIMDAILGLAWLEEEEGKLLGWGDMYRIHHIFSEGL